MAGSSTTMPPDTRGTERNAQLPPAGATVILWQSGANDPRFNLRREPLLIQRVTGATDATFVNLLEPHGAYDPAAETVVGSRSAVRRLSHVRADAADLVTIELGGNRTVTLAIADSVDPAARHRATLNGRELVWTGHWGRFDTEVAK